MDSKMSRIRHIWCFVGLIFVVPTFAQDMSNEMIKPLPNSLQLDPRKVELGKKLFHDKRLSANDTISCASCHDLNTAGVDNKPVSDGVKGQKGPINSPTVLNSSQNFAQFWDGRAKNLEDQAEGPILNPVEMGSNWRQALSKLKKDPIYVQSFKDIYGTDITPDAIKNAIAVFEESLITPAPFDRYLRGDNKAISSRAKLGYELFKSTGCIACHNGVNVGGNMYQKFGLVEDYFADRGNITEADYGRFNVTKNDTDKYVFKVPTLRNVQYTAPYLHDGSIETLPEVVKIMAKYQLGRTLTDAEVKDIVAFLNSLSGDDVKHPSRKEK